MPEPMKLFWLIASLSYLVISVQDPQRQYAEFWTGDSKQHQKKLEKFNLD